MTTQVLGKNLAVRHNDDGTQDFVNYETVIARVDWAKREVLFNVDGTHLDWHGKQVSNHTPTTVRRLNEVSELHNWPVRFARKQGHINAWFYTGERFDSGDYPLPVTFDLDEWGVVA